MPKYKLKHVGEDGWGRTLYLDEEKKLYFCDTNLLPPYDPGAHIHIKYRDPEGEPSHAIKREDYEYYEKTM
jgi:hypothetical protein